jgi:GNAT superfamily N-acetyltransferase
MPVRHASPDDVPALVAAYAWLFAAPGAVPDGWDEAVAARRLRAAIEDPRAAVLVAGDVAGFCTAYLDLESVRFGPRCWVEDLAVDPARRSAGVGAALLEAARRWAREQGATHLELDSSDARVDAHRFYERERPSATSRCFSWTL